MALPLAAAVIVGYLLGALPFGFLVARWHGVDIFAAGSKNPGATNVRRVVGKGAGDLVFALDFLKGLVAATWVHLWSVEPPPDPVWLVLAGIAAAVLGHSFSVFTGFRGGKGVATTLGGTVALMPAVALIAAVAWVVLFFSTRYVSVASIGLAVVLPLAAYFLHGLDVRFAFASVAAAFVIYRHRSNIGRLLRGTENRFPPKVEGRHKNPL